MNCPEDLVHVFEKAEADAPVSIFTTPLRYNLTTAMSATYTPLTPSSPGYST
jgi:hypothetical protein